MKRCLLFLILSYIAIYNLLSVSFNEGNSIKIREGLFFSDDELSKFQWKSGLSNAEEKFFDNTRISLVTGGQGDEIWELFGHASFLVESPNNPDIMFDYGIFSFDKDFYKNFALGKLYYSMMESHASPRISNLKMADRDIYKLELNLSALEKCNLLLFLEYNNKAENRIYLYDYYLDNCATRLRDSYSYITGGEFRSWAENNMTGMTLRDYTIKYLSPVFIADWAINYLLGPSVDNKMSLWDAMFLPDILRESIEEYQGTESSRIYASESRSKLDTHNYFYLKTLILSLILTAIITLTYSKHRFIIKTGDLLSALIYIILFIMSAVLLFLETASIHKVTYFNTSLLVISPVTFIFAYLHIASLIKEEKRIKIKKLSSAMLIITLSLLIAKLIIIKLFYNANWAYYIVMIPLYAADSNIIDKIRYKKEK